MATSKEVQRLSAIVVTCTWGRPLPFWLSFSGLFGLSQDKAFSQVTLLLSQGSLCFQWEMLQRSAWFAIAELPTAGQVPYSLTLDYVKCNHSYRGILRTDTNIQHLWVVNQICWSKWRNWSFPSLCTIDRRGGSSLICNISAICVRQENFSRVGSVPNLRTGELQGRVQP